MIQINKRAKYRCLAYQSGLTQNGIQLQFIKPPIQGTKCIQI